MKLASAITLYAGRIGDAAKAVLHRRSGKRKGLEKIEDQIRETIRQGAASVLGDVDLDDEALASVDDFVEERMGYMRNAFKQLHNPKTDTSSSRADFIDTTEYRYAKNFGKARGHMQRGTRLKVWVDYDGCPDCAENADVGPIPVDEEFPSGDLTAPAHPGCQCDVEYINEDEDEDE